jgi:hypothetical protein
MMGRLSRRYNSFRVMKKMVRRERGERKKEIRREVRQFGDGGRQWGLRCLLAVVCQY